MSEQQRVSTRVDAEVIEVIRRVAEVERRPPSAVIRIALEVDLKHTRGRKQTRLKFLRTRPRPVFSMG